MNPQIYYQFKINEINEMFVNFNFGNKSSYVNSDRILRSSNSIFFNNPFANKNLIILSGKHNNYQIFLSLHPSVLPNSEEPGEPNSLNTKIYLSKFEYNFVDKHVEYFDQ